MLFKSVKAQMHIMLKNKTTWIMFYILLGFVLYNYWNTFPLYKGLDVLYMPHPARLSLLALDNPTHISNLFFQLYPLLVILPAGFSLAWDYESKACVFIYSKVGGMNYYMGKLIAAFLVSTLVFSIPLLIELGMNFFTYPREAITDTDATASYSENALSIYTTYFWGMWEADFPYKAVIAGILRFGIVSGILNMFTVALSTRRVQLKVLLFFPAYMLLYGLHMVNSSEITTSYPDYLSVFVPFVKYSRIGFVGFLTVLVIISVIIMYRNGKKEMLI